MKWPDYPIKKITIEDKLYPAILKEIKNPPKVLYYRGKWDNRYFEKSLAIVGSRRLTRYGQTVIEKFVSQLVLEKVTIISGFMYGTDTNAHQQTLENGGITIAVLGNGLNIVYPPENEKLYEQILIKNGLIISEYESEHQPYLWTFPQRNRIVAGLSSLGVLIIEAGEKSGSLITADYAKQQGKKVYCVPGPITSSISAGTNLLIKNHQAKMVLTAGDILGKKTGRQTLFDNLELTPTEKTICDLLATEPLTVDEIALKTNQSITQISQTLTLMSLKNLISESIGKFYLNS